MTGPRVILMGLRGSGKTTLGRALAERLEVPFVDLDDRTAAALGTDQPGQALREQGEPAFRAAETECLRATLSESGLVLALGGGTPTAPGADQLLRDAASNGSVVCYLCASPSALGDRIGAAGAPDRPALMGVDAISEIIEVHAARDPLYQSIATAVVHTDGVGEEALLAMLESLVS